MQDTADLYARHRGRQFARGLVREAERHGWAPGFVEAGFVRRLHEEDRGRGEGNSRNWKDTAIFITFDEGGGYYDSGYVQPLDFFGEARAFR